MLALLWLCQSENLSTGVSYYAKSESKHDARIEANYLCERDDQTPYDPEHPAPEICVDVECHLVPQAVLEEHMKPEPSPSAHPAQPVKGD